MKTIDIIKDFIPKERYNRPCVKITPTSITVHNTGNSAKSANAYMHASYIKSTTQNVSWHFTVDDQIIIQHIPIDEMAWHTGCREGNKSSIGIEICMNQGIDMPKAEQNAQDLIVHLMNKTNIKQIKKHQDWTGKYCPYVLLKENRWDRFKEACYDRLDQLTNQETSHWAMPYYNQLINKGIEINEQRFNDPLTRGELFAMMCRMLEA